MELLVVITIIGILISLLLPAVQSAREAARRLQCGNNLKQLGLGMQNHLTAYGFFPGGGWGTGWIGDPDHGTGKNQPGGWLYCILPYIEQQSLHDLGAGLADKSAAHIKRLQTPLAIIACPTRRRAELFDSHGAAYNLMPTSTYYPKKVARSCYAANIGDTSRTVIRGPNNLSSVDNGSYTSWPDNSDISGISFIRSEIAMSNIRDGASNTYCLGEKHIDPDQYLTGYDGGDDAAFCDGQQDDLYRSGGYMNPGTNPATYTYWPPVQDKPGGTVYSNNFGSAHVNACNFVFCDGSVRNISYSIDPEIHRRLCNRQDGLPIDGSKF